MNAVPELIKNYISAQNDHNVEQRLLCFAPDAIVFDEGETIQATDSIRNWMLKTEAKYSQTLKAKACDVNGDDLVLTAETSGTFPGSPLDLDFHFKVKNDRISRLEIKLTPES